MTVTKARAEAAQKAAEGKLSFIESIKHEAVDLWANDHKKFLASSLALLGEAVSVGLLHGTALKIAVLVLAAGGTGAVKVLKNTRPAVK